MGRILLVSVRPEVLHADGTSGDAVEVLEVVSAVVGAHGDQGRCDDHRQKDEGKNEVVYHVEPPAGRPEGRL